MGRPRKPIKLQHEGLSHVARFAHPVLGRTVRINLGADPQEARAHLAALNRVFLNPDLWQNPPADLPEPVRRAWGVERSGVVMPPPVMPPPETAAAEMADLQAEVRTRDGEIARLRAENMRLRRELRRWRGRGLDAVALARPLGEAADEWLAAYRGRSHRHVLDMRSELRRFTRRFGAETPLADLEGAERRISEWLAGLVASRGPRQGQPLSAGRRVQARQRVLRFLADVGVAFDRSQIPRPSKVEVRRDRGAVRWLEIEDARRLADALPDYWRDAWRLQVATGLRPGEIPTIEAADLSVGGGVLTLSPGPGRNLTLKNGSRTIRLPDSAREILARRLADDTVAYRTATGLPWHDPGRWCRYYARALRDAAETAEIAVRVDARIGRRTCASLLVRAGRSIEQVAALLGDDPATVREHYSALTAADVDAGGIEI